MHTRSKVVVVVTLCSLFMSAWLLAEGPAKPLAEVAISASRVDWQPAGDYEHVVLTIAGPEGLWLRKEFAAGQPASLGVFDQVGSQLPDGAYSYELQFVPRQAGDRSERPLRQSGSFAVREGSFAASFEGPVTKPEIRKVTAATEVIPEDLVVQGKACVGDLCTSVNPFGQLLQLKNDYNVGIFFEDVQDGISYSRDWLLQANGFQGDNDRFFLADIDAGTTPVSVYGPAQQDTLVLRSGKVGIGTAFPGALLHVFGTATSDAFAGMGPDPVSGPALNFGYGGASLGRGAGFFNVRPDASATAPNPSLRFLTANVERMILTNTGSVGIGTSSPAYKFHVFENLNANTVSTVETSNTGVNAAAFFRAQSDAGVNQIGMHSSGRTATRFGQTLGGRGEILHVGGNGLLIGTLEADSLILGTNNANRLEINGSTGAVTVSGNLTVNGTFSNPSSLSLKEDFKPLDPKMVLDKFVRLPIQEWSYKSDDRKLRHVGPTVEDFQASFGLGTEGQHIFPMDVQGVTMTAVQGLHQVVQEKDAEIAELRQRLSVLEELVSKLATQ